MNYLVHLFLSGDDPLVRLGGLMGDFVKGAIPGHYPEPVRIGLDLHRRVDSLAHRSRYTRRSRQRIDPRFGHVRSIMVDIFYDHFLAVHWSEYHPRPLTAYAADTYALLRRHEPLLPAGLAEIAPRMAEHDWLVAYSHRQAVANALRRLGERLSRPTPLAEGYTELDRHEEPLLDDFRGFMDEAEQFASSELDRLGAPSAP